jgi:hypothetical protein
MEDVRSEDVRSEGWETEGWETEGAQGAPRRSGCRSRLRAEALQVTGGSRTVTDVAEPHRSPTDEVEKHRA